MARMLLVHHLQCPRPISHVRDWPQRPQHQCPPALGLGLGLRPQPELALALALALVLALVPVVGTVHPLAAGRLERLHWTT